MSIDGNNDNELFLTDVLTTSGSTIPKNYGIYYIQDVNEAGQDMINILKNSLQNIERGLLSKNEDKTISDAGKDFLNKFLFLIEYTEKRINVSPIEQQEQDRKLRHAVRSSKKTEIEIKLFEDSLEMQRIDNKKSIDKLKTEFIECEDKIKMKEEEIKNSVKLIVNESEKQMIESYKESISNQDSLNSEIEIMKSRLNNIRENNIRIENELRNKRRNVETDLSNCLSKYDKDIGDRNKEMENLSKEFNLLNSQRKTLENDVMINLRKLHDDLTNEKSEALLKIRDEKLKRFIQNRAAVTIQRSWRSYWERHCAKKKKKSRKK